MAEGGKKKKKKSKFYLDSFASSAAVLSAWRDCFRFFLSLPLSVDLRSAINFAPTSEEDNFLASAKASRLPLGVNVSSGILKVFTCPWTPLTHSSCSAYTRGSICTGRKTHDQRKMRNQSQHQETGKNRWPSVSHAQQLQKWHVPVEDS